MWGYRTYEINGKPPLLLDVLQREFTFFGTTLYPTDTFLLALLMLIVFLGLFFLTAMFGRVWCGWVCPQTVYLELVFRPIERFFDGAPGKKTKTGGWRKPAKIAVYVVLSLALAHTFLSYFVGHGRAAGVDDAVAVGASDLVLRSLFGVTGLMLFDFGFFREQLCIVACPYGRMQSVMLDRDSLIVGYDRLRGEPRGKLRKGTKDVSLKTVAAEQPGDCIDCRMCVTTCPTGIDIRDGLQLECVNCTQCIDACDSIMDKIGKPRGLIRYSSQRQLEEGESRWKRPRLLVYPVIVGVLLTVLVTSLATREAVMVNVLRGPGFPYQKLAEGRIGNVVRVKIHDRTRDGGVYTVSVVGDGVAGAVLGEPNPVRVDPGQLETASLVLSLPGEAFAGGHANETVVVTGDDGERFEAAYRMLGPSTLGSE